MEKSIVRLIEFQNQYCMRRFTQSVLLLIAEILIKILHCATMTGCEWRSESGIHRGLVITICIQWEKFFQVKLDCSVTSFEEWRTTIKIGAARGAHAIESEAFLSFHLKIPFKLNFNSPRRRRIVIRFSRTPFVSLVTRLWRAGKAPLLIIHRECHDDDVIMQI